jgi:sodium transport system ATP-binding protein
VIVIEGLQKRYGSVRAVDGVSFEAPDARVTGLLGPNGAGKTTTLRMLSTLIAPDAGRALVDGIDVHKEPRAALRQLGVLPDGRGLYPRLSAREHLRYFGALQGMMGAGLEGRIAALVDLLDMKDIVDRRVAGFSQGERTKVAIARALIHAPKNVVLDEATNGLDVMSTRAMREVIRRLAADGTCVLFSSHVMQEVSALCDHIVIFARGRVVMQGSPESLLERTAQTSLENAFVQIIGSDAGLVR